MNLLDLRTVMVSYAISNFICMVVMIMLWRQNRARFDGLGCWVAYFVLQFSALVLITLRGFLPELISSILSNPMILGGSILVLIGLERFLEMRGLQVHNYFLLIVFFLTQLTLVLSDASISARAIVFSLAILAVNLQSVWLLFWRVPQEMRWVTRFVGYVFVGSCLTGATRIVIELLVPWGSTYFQASAYQTFLFVINQMLFIALTLSLALMLNRRLLIVLEKDIEMRKQGEAMMRLRLDLWEYAGAHSTQELMQKALDEIENLTGNQVSFFHSVEEDQNKLSLQAWSTPTLREYCLAEGDARHSPISEAGVWADAVRTRRPVIHNDYDSLPNRNGVLEGHVNLDRELVVPTIRRGKVVAILGVGNKPAGYNAHDVDVIEYLADMVWTIVEQKRADEQIRELESYFERQALIDEMTRLPNRRAFFIRGNEEMKRALRYETPLSLMMLDIDFFKHINDTFGHDAGDAALRSFAGAIQRNCREFDVAGRLGGDEFVILLPNTRLAEAVSVAERLRAAVERESFSIHDRSFSITTTIGVSSFCENMQSFDDFLRKSDTALYRAKNQGRNQVVQVD